MKKNHFFHRVGSLLLAAALAVSLTATALAKEPPVDPPAPTNPAVPTDPVVPPDQPTPPGTLTDFTIKLPETSLLTLGIVGELKAELVPVPETAPIDPAAVTWSWSSQTLSVVGFEGGTDQDTVTLMPVQAGQSLITVSAKVNQDGKVLEKTATCLVTVQFTAAESIIIIPNDLPPMEPRAVRDLTASVSPTTADPTNVVWSSSDSNVVQLSSTTGQNVTITAGSPGKATITASSGDTAHGTCFVEVRGLVLSDTSISIPVGTNKTVGATPFGGIGTLVEWTSGNESIAFVAPGGVITGQSVGKTSITATVAGYSATCEVTVTENTANQITGSIDVGLPFSFADIASELNERSHSVLGESLSYVTNLQVDTNQGILHYGYSSPDDPGAGVGSTERYYYSNSIPGTRALSDVIFFPDSSFNGTASIRYTGYGIGNKSFTGVIRLKVEGSKDVSYTTSAQTPLLFQAADFSAICQARLGRDLSYVTFEQPQASRGTLYYNYGGQGQYSEKVTPTTQYNRTRSPYLDSVSFVPADNFTGTVRISYRCVDTSGNSFNGRVVITVVPKKTSGTGDLSYKVRGGEKVTFRAADFNNACVDTNGTTLNYVRFDLPDSSKGTLYYNYRTNSGSNSKVSDTTRYYRSGNPSLSNITFVPKTGYSGSVLIDFSGYDVRGERFDGQVSIEVSGGSGGYEEVVYTSTNGQPVTFSGTDFNEACQKANDERLDYVRFDLPPSNVGTLYYDYSNGSRNQKVSASTKYYRNSSPSLSRITFVPKAGFVGTASIDFSGYDSTGHRFSGTVLIAVDQSKNASISYSVATGGAVPFDTADFNRVSRTLTGDPLSYVRFTLPPSDRGLLCYQYNSKDGTYHSKVSSNTSYFYSSKSSALEDVTFLSDPNYSGTVEVEYTGWSTRRERFDGVVTIQVSTPTATAIQYVGCSTPISIRSSDLRNMCTSALGRELSHLRFPSLPAEEVGRLYHGYVSPNETGVPVSTGTNYYVNRAPAIDQLTFVPKAGFQGTVTLPYSGYDSTDSWFSGTIEITISNGYCVDRFTDMGGYDWAKPSVEFLYENGISTGVSSSRFDPAQNIKRGDFALMLCRAFQFQSSSTGSFTDVPPKSYYANAIGTAQSLGIVQGNKGRFMPQNPITRQDAMVMLQRALIAAGKSSSVGNTNLLSSYADGHLVSDYAKSSVASMIQLGAVQGNQSNQLNPLSPISRAEMAVILHRVLAQ